MFGLEWQWVAIALAAIIVIYMAYEVKKVVKNRNSQSSDSGSTNG